MDADQEQTRAAAEQIEGIKKLRGEMYDIRHIDPMNIDFILFVAVVDLAKDKNGKGK